MLISLENNNAIDRLINEIEEENELRFLICELYFAKEKLLKQVEKNIGDICNFEV